MKLNAVILSAFLAVAATCTSQAQLIITLTTSQGEITPGTKNQGWWSSTFNQFASNTNQTYTTGFSGSNVFRSYFTFDMSNLVIPQGMYVSDVTLRLTRYDQSAPVTIEFHDVSTSASDLAQKGTGPSIPIFDDLGSGQLYGSQEVPVGLYDEVLSFSMNQTAINAVTAQAGSGYFSIGAKLQNETGPRIFGLMLNEGTQELVVTLSPIPEPSTIAILSLGIATIGGIAIRRRMRIHAEN